MVAGQSNYDQLMVKLDAFIRKYYVNRCIRGGLYTTGLVLGLFLALNLLEYYFYFGTGVRKTLFFLFVGSTAAAVAYWIFDPLFRYFKLGNTISHEEAALIIGSHFSDVQDKLLNILQLRRQEFHATNAALIEASIEQKTQSIRLVPFQAAIDLNKNRTYLKYALPPLLLLLVILLAAPGIIREGTTRIIQNDKQFVKAAPFYYTVSNRSLEVVQFQDFTLDIKVDGTVLPNEVFVNVDGFQYNMEKVDPTTFRYTFRNVQRDIDFVLSAGSVLSEEYTLSVLKKPNLVAFRMSLDYPAYTGRKDEQLLNTGDVTLPEGTVITWLFDAEETEDITLYFGDSPSPFKADRNGETSFRHNRRAKDDEMYRLYLSNKRVPVADSLLYSITVVKDAFPQITAEKVMDSLDQSVVYFIGNASDDYGLQSLSFNYVITSANGTIQPLQKVKMQKQDGREIQFDYIFDVNKTGLSPGDKISFYFEVTDNDGVNGSKSSKSGVMTIEKPTMDEIAQLENKNEEDIKNELKDALKAMDKLQENLKKLKDKLLQDKELDWQDKKEMEKILDEQKKLQEQIEKAKEKLEENIKNQEEFKTQPEEIQEEQKKLQELFEKAVNPEEQELLDKIKELLQELDKEDAVQMMEQFETSSDKKEKEMERLLELFKQLETEKEIKEQISALEKLAEEQEKLAEKTEKNQGSESDLKKEQQELNKKMEDLIKKQQALEKKNKEIQVPKDMGEQNKEKMEDAKQDMDKSEEQMEKKDNQGASKSQKRASRKMKQQAAEMKQSMSSGASKQASEDVKTLRQLLENLVTVSFDQEKLFKLINGNMVNTPAFPAAIRQQFKLQGDFRVIEDTLVALSNRNPDIEGYVMDKVAEIKAQIDESLTLLEERQVPQGQERQRYIMKNLNDLALMMNESLDKAQQQASGKPGSGSCDKPGGQGGKENGKMPMDKISEGQKKLSEGLKEMKESMEKGKKEGKEGKDGKSGKDGSAKDFAEAAARQAALRKALEALNQEKKEQGKGSKELEEIIQNMDRIETELVNKRLNTETLKRLKEIETRLLEAEKAEQQREQDDKRKSETAQEKRKVLPPALQEYMRKRQAEIDMYKSLSPTLRPYYKTLVDEYYKALKTGR